jgi:excisionase family DNA binding protein
MRPETITAVQTMVKTVLAADPTVTAEEAARIMKACQGQPPRWDLLTAREAAKILGVHLRTLQTYGRQGKITPIRHGIRRIRWDRAEIEHFAAYGMQDEKE